MSVECAVYRINWPEMVEEGYTLEDFEDIDPDFMEFRSIDGSTNHKDYISFYLLMEVLTEKIEDPSTKAFCSIWNWERMNSERDLPDSFDAEMIPVEFAWPPEMVAEKTSTYKEVNLDLLKPHFEALPRDHRFDAPPPRGFNEFKSFAQAWIDVLKEASEGNFGILMIVFC